MSGNVYEWNFDRYPTDSASIRVGRGGSWDYSADDVQVGNWGSYGMYNSLNYMGLRVARSR